MVQALSKSSLPANPSHPLRCAVSCVRGKLARNLTGQSCTTAPASALDRAAGADSLSTVAVLCARRDSVYESLPGVEVYDEARDARTFEGGFPVVAHPPCRLWFKLAHFVKLSAAERASEMELGHFCASQVKAWGGILEHPAGSRLFSEAGLPQPGQPNRHGFTLSVPQYWFGHLGIKDTWLFCAGIEPAELPPIPFRLLEPSRRAVEFQSKRQREATPRAFAEWLLEAARGSLVETGLAI